VDRSLASAPGATPPMRSTELMAVSRMADEHTRRAFNLAGRGAMYSARDEFIEALQMMAHAIDADRRTHEHSQALADGLTAIRESDDFDSRGGRMQDNIDVIDIAKAHATPVLKGLEPRSVSRMAAMQQYYTYAQRRFAFAVAPEPSGSVALYGLGKLHTVLAQTPSQGIVSAEPKAIVFHQAALLVDGRNYMAANDLGVLLARYGRYEQAKAALIHSLSVSPQPAGWHNLTVVHQQLGEVKLAQLAAAESQAAKARAKQVAAANGQSMTDTTTVVWLDPVTFGRSSEMWSDPAKPNGPENATQSTANKPSMNPPADAPKKGWFRK
jgi:tetratricopeptide (TPR) repeat protein